MKYNVICDSSGFKIKRDQAEYQWNGMLVRKDLKDPYPDRLKHPNTSEILTVPDARPDTDVFIDLPTEEDVGS